MGKSRLAQASGHEICHRGCQVRFTSFVKMFGHLNGGRVDGTRERRLATFLCPDLLILDNYGLLPPRGHEPEDFYDIINERYE